VLMMVIGGITAFVSATIGMTQFDIKKVFAYSTVSQLGYMFMACAAGAYSAGIFHVATHAFFKALLFLGAGSVIHALHGEQDMRHMGGLKSKIPQTFYTMCAAWLAISGVPFLSGGMSKDEILVAVHHTNPFFYWVGVLTAAITAFYVTRAMMMTFFGEYRGKAHPHESPAMMTVPLWILAALSIGGGYLLKDIILHGHEVAHEGMAGTWPIIAGVAGLVLGYMAYSSPEATLASSFSKSVGPLYQVVNDKYRIDEAYDNLFVQPIKDASKYLLWQKMDMGLIDGIVDGVADAARGIGDLTRKMSSGAIPTYATWVVYGAILVVITMGFLGGAK
jgi:NADH-quinone oxidoreductase subunit L